MCVEFSDAVCYYKIHFTDAGAPSGLSRSSRAVMTTVQGVICFYNIKRNIFQSMLHIHALRYYDTPVIYLQ